jgi:hypothetical protein
MRLAATVLLGTGGVVLVASLFADWRVTTDDGWAVWDWVDAVYVALAATLVVTAAAVRRGRVAPALLAVLGVLCVAGAAVVAGHGFDDAAGTPTRAPWVAIGAFVAALAGVLIAGFGLRRAAPERSSPALAPLLTAAAAITIALSLALRWDQGASTTEELAWARHPLQAVALTILAGLLLFVARVVEHGRAPRGLLAGAAALAAGALAFLLAAGLDGELPLTAAFVPEREPLPTRPADGPRVALAGVALAAAGLALAWLRPRAPAARGG